MGARTVPFTPVPGKLGSITVAGISSPVNLAMWQPTQRCEALEVTNFNSPTDTNTNVHQEFIPGTVGTSFSVSGVRDVGAVGWNPTAGDTGTATLLYAPGFGFTFAFICTDVGGGQDVKKLGEFSATIQATGLCQIVRP